MEYEDRVTLIAPEGIELQYTLAGLGSRFIAEVLDDLIQVAVLIAVLLLLSALGVGSTGHLIAVVVWALARLPYWIGFEVWGGGRTPGKRMTGLRVVMASGRPVTFGPSAVRNVIRLVDIYATFGIAATVSILTTKKDQRLGDLAAGTLVIRDAVPRRRRRRARATAAAGSSSGPPGSGHQAPAGLDVTAVSADELATIREFLVRRDRLSRDARARVAQRLADGVRGRTGGLGAGATGPEDLLEAVVAAKRRG